MQILAATDFSTRSNRALRQAGLLAQPSNAQLHIVHVVDDDQPEVLVRMEMREAERLLKEQVSSMAELQGTQSYPMVIAADPFDGILRAAEKTQPNLIVMGSHRKQMLRDIFVGTTIERVVRKGSFPVLMVNHEAQRRYERAVLPVDMSKASAHAIHSALKVGLIDGSAATLVHALSPMEKGKLAYAGVNETRMSEYVAGERQLATDEMAAFLVENNLADRGWPRRIEEGSPIEVISRAVEELRPDLLVVGTHGRSPLIRGLIGSVTEDALRSLNVDILAVPPSRS